MAQATTEGAEIKRRVALGIFGSRSVLEAAVLKSLDDWYACPDIEADGVRLVGRERERAGGHSPDQVLRQIYQVLPDQGEGDHGMSETPVYDEVKAEYPDLEIPTCVGLTYEECVEHAKPPIQPTGYPAARPDEVHEPGCTGEHMADGTNDCIREASDESKDVQA